MTPHPVRPGRVVSAISCGALALFLTFHPETSRSDEPASIEWQNEYTSAFEAAQADNRLLWIQFTGPWCPNCTRMERDSFPHAPVVAHARTSFLPLKLQADVNAQLIA